MKKYESMTGKAGAKDVLRKKLEEELKKENCTIKELKPLFPSHSFKTLRAWIEEHREKLGVFRIKGKSGIRIPRKNFIDLIVEQVDDFSDFKLVYEEED